MDLLISYHKNLIEGLLLIMALNLLIPWAFSKNRIRMVFWTRVGFFAFWALWTMVVFSGLIVFVFMKQKLSLPVDIMIAFSLLLPFMDGYRAIKLRKLWLKEETGLLFNSVIVGLEIVGILIVTWIALQG